MYKMAILSKIKSHSDAVDYFKELPFYNKPIEKPKVKRLKNINWLVSFFLWTAERNKTNKAIRTYLMSYKFEIIEQKNAIVSSGESKY